MGYIILDSFFNDLINLCEELCHGLKLIKFELNSFKLLAELYDRKKYSCLVNEYYEILNKIILLSIRNRKLFYRTHCTSEDITQYISHCSDILDLLMLCSDNLKQFIESSHRDLAGITTQHNLKLSYILNFMIEHLNKLKGTSCKIRLLLLSNNNRNFSDYISYFKINNDKFYDLSLLNHRFYLSL